MSVCAFGRLIQENLVQAVLSNILQCQYVDHEEGSRTGTGEQKMDGRFCVRRSQTERAESCASCKHLAPDERLQFLTTDRRELANIIRKAFVVLKNTSARERKHCRSERAF